MMAIPLSQAPWGVAVSSAFVSNEVGFRAFGSPMDASIRMILEAYVAHLAGQNRFGIPFWLVGEFTTHFRIF